MAETSGPNNLSSLLATKRKEGVEALKDGIYCTRCHVVKEASDYFCGGVYVSLKRVPHARGTCCDCVRAANRLRREKRKQTSVEVAGDVPDVVADEGGHEMFPLQARASW